VLGALIHLFHRQGSLKELGELQRATQWRLDIVAAENSMGFHAPQEMARILGESIDMSRQAQFKAGEVLHGRVVVASAAAPLKNAKTMSR
jgi:nitrite reductase (cytochrome c-552)